MSPSSSQIIFTAWLPLAISKPSTSSTAQAGCPGQNTGWAWPWLVQPQGNPRASTPSGHLQTTVKLHNPAPAQLILHGGWRLVVSGHRQSLQLTSLGKSLPLTCQQQPRLNYKEGCTQSTGRVYLKYLAWVVGEVCHWTLQVV